jgi:hypothetical protein
VVDELGDVAAEDPLPQDGMQIGVVDEQVPQVLPPSTAAGSMSRSTYRSPTLRSRWSL